MKKATKARKAAGYAAVRKHDAKVKRQVKKLYNRVLYD